MLKFSRLSIVLVLVIVISLFSGITGVNATTCPTNLQYFGYYHADGTPWDDGKTNIDAIGSLNNSNVVTLNYWDYISPENVTILRNEINKADSYGMKVFINMYAAFFAWNPGGMGDGSAYVLEDWQNRYNALKSAISGYESKIIGFEFDEPYWNGVRSSDFIWATQMVKDDYPTKKIFACDTLCAFDPTSWGLPADKKAPTNTYKYCTDLAFDWYDGTWDNGLYDYWTDYMINNYAINNQSIWNIVKLHNSDGVNNCIKNIARMYEMAKRKARIVGMLCYTYDNSGNDNIIGDPSVSIYEPYLRRIHVDIGRNIINQSLNQTDFFDKYNDFSSIQGQNQWYYQWYDGTTYYNMTWDNVSQLWRGNQYYELISQTSMHPDIQDSALKWVAPKSGKIYITSNGKIRDAVSNGGDGVRVAIFKNNTQIWPASGWQAIASGDLEGVDCKVTVDVSTGDAIYFRINRGTANNSDGDETIWQPIVAYQNDFVASEGFSSTQGGNQWNYMQENGGNYTSMTYDATNKQWVGSFSKCLITAYNERPQTNNAARKWTAPRSGTVRITSAGFNNNLVKKLFGGDGVNIKIMKNATQIWPASGWQALAGDNYKVGIDLNLSSISVNAGDSIYFVVNQNSNDTCDLIQFNPVVVYN